MKGLPGALVVTDACCLINLYATGRAEDLVTRLGLRMVMAPAVLAQARSLRGPRDPDTEQYTRLPIDTTPLIQAGCLRTEDPDNTLLVEGIVAGLSETDASALAVARGLNTPLLTDDRFVVRITHELAPQIECIGTLELIRAYLEVIRPPTEDIGLLFERLRDAGRFVPGPRTPGYAWYREVMGR